MLVINKDSKVFSLFLVTHFILKEKINIFRYEIITSKHVHDIIVSFFNLYAFILLTSTFVYLLLVVSFRIDLDFFRHEQ